MKLFGSARNRTGKGIEAWGVDPFSRDTLKAFTLLDALRDIEPVGGAIVECGVGSGGSLSALAYLLDQMGIDRPVYAFDSFQGFPEGTPEDAAEFSPSKKRIYEQFTVNFVKGNVARRCGGDERPGSRINYVPGFFPDSFAAFEKQPVALLHVDVDLYQGYVDSLGFFVPMMPSGAMILFDEYDQGNDLVKWPGAKRAVDEFIDSTGHTLERHFTGYTQIRIP